MWWKSVLVACVFLSCFFVDLYDSNSAWAQSREEKHPEIVYYVDINGNDSNDGSMHKPWRSLHYAASRVKAGDTVLINPGRYIETKQISIKTSGEKEKRITFRGNGKGVIIDLTGLPDKNGFEIYFANYITIENLTVHASRHKDSRGIRLTHSRNSIIRNNIVSGAGHGNYFCSLSDYTIFENNEAYNGRIGIYVADSTDYAIIRNNLLHNNSAIGLHMNGDLGSSDGNDGIISHALVENNIIYDNDGTGINLDGVTESVFRNNLLYDNKKRGIAFFKKDGAVPSNDNYIIHNTIIMPGGAYYAIGLNYGAYRNSFYNNIIFTDGSVPCFSTSGKSNELKIVSDYNLMPDRGKIGEITNRRISLREWRGLGYDKHSLEGTISDTFLNEKANEYQLNTAGSAIDAGTPDHSFGKDLLGNVRPKEKPDIGAYEFEVVKKYKIKRESQSNIEHPIPPKKTASASTSNEPLRDIQKEKKSEKSLSSLNDKKLTNSLGMEFVFVPPGAFVMGIVSDVYGESKNSIPHEVTLTKGFYLQNTEVTQRQWKNLMGNNPSFFKDCGDDCPVEQVSWNEVRQFIERLNQAEQTHKYRLPTEAEWEYACRAETMTPFSFGNCLTTKEANYCGNYPFENCQKGVYREMPVSVKNFPPNAWGLIGMHGNVWEWCQDRFDHYPDGPLNNPSGPSSGSLRVIRGGSWNSYAKACRSGNRSGSDPTKCFANLGFRLVREP